MPTLDWIGKKAVLNHHRQVPYHLLRCDNSLSVGESGSGNLLVQGDNLLALKALLPYYAGQVKCIYIDPPYNTGNENWVYNDAVNSPEMRKWLGHVVGGEAEDLSRHDKWLCMMYPRLALLKEFLREDGAIFVSLDDNEIASFKLMMDELFGPRNFVAIIVWQKKYSTSNDHTGIAPMHDYIIVYRRSECWHRNLLPRTDEKDRQYKFEDEQGIFRLSDYTCNKTGEERPNLYYAITNPHTGKQVWPSKTRVWAYSQEKHAENVENGLVFWGKEGKAEVPSFKRYKDKLKRGGATVPFTWWAHEFAGHTDAAKKEVRALDVGERAFDFVTPKPVQLIKRVLQISTDKDSLVLDSFAGSGTTGHAVLEMNKADGGNRRFILVEMEPEICREVTAQRLQRVIDGYVPQGATAGGGSSPSNAGGLTARAGVQAKAAESVPGLGGGFRYCTLAEPLFDETGKIRPEVKFADLASHVYFTETGEPLAMRRNKPPALPGERNGKKASPGSAATATAAALAGERNGKKASPGSAGGLLSSPGGAGDRNGKEASPGSAGGLSPLIGVCKGTAYYLLFNGVLGDKRPDGGNVLTGKVLHKLPPHDGPKVVYGEGCRLGAARLAREEIVFKQVPYEIKVS